MSEEEEEWDPDAEDENYGDEEEYVVESPNGDEIIFSPESFFDQQGYDNFNSVVNTYNAYLYDQTAMITTPVRVELSLSRSFLPLSMQAVYGFLVHPNILNIGIELTQYDWTRRPSIIEVKHPVYDNSFIGRPLVMEVVDKFFTRFYHPRQHYKSASYLLTPSGRAKTDQIMTLQREGYDTKKAENALVLCRNDIEKARTFLRTGELPPSRSKSDNSNIQLVDYKQCPLLYFILEIAEAFLDLADHCCICRDPLTPGIKPSVCQKPLCNFQLTQIGVGNSVTQEIQRDPLAADLVLSIFSAALDTQFLTPAPPDFTVKDCIEILKTLPTCKEMANCQNDIELSSIISPHSLNLLRWILLSNRSHLISLPNAMQFSEFKGSHQFMSLISAPEAEETFQQLKHKYGSIYLWHGSHGLRWHSILRNGLKNATGTKLQANGAALGSGIYFARDSQTSWGYSQKSPNRYVNSSLGKELHIISLCEIAKVPELKDHGWAHTMAREDSCIVRFMFCGGSFGVDVLNNPPKKVPKLKEVLEFHADTARQ